VGEAGFGKGEVDGGFEVGDAVLAIGLGDANGYGGAKEPEGSGFMGELGGCFWMFSGGRGGFKAEFYWAVFLLKGV
jgi:hypothetical protein